MIADTVLASGLVLPGSSGRVGNRWIGSRRRPALAGRGHARGVRPPRQRAHHSCRDDAHFGVVAHGWPHPPVSDCAGCPPTIPRGTFDLDRAGAGLDFSSVRPIVGPRCGTTSGIGCPVPPTPIATTHTLARPRALVLDICGYPQGMPLMIAGAFVY